MHRRLRRLACACAALLILTPNAANLPVAHADTVATVNSIASTLNITNQTQISALDVDFDTATQPGVCAGDFLDMVTNLSANKKFNKGALLSCGPQINNILRILSPYMLQQQNISPASLFLPYPLAPDPVVGLLYQIYSTPTGQTLLQDINTGVDINECGEFVGMLSEAGLGDAIALEVASEGMYTGALFVGLALTCGQITPQILSYLSNIFSMPYYPAPGQSPNSTPLASTAPLACIAHNIQSIACVAKPAPTGGGGGTGSGGSGSGGTTPPPPPPCSPGTNQTSLFTGTNYGGQCVILNNGTYNDPASMNIPNDSVESVKVGGSAKLELCRDNGLSNTCQWFTSNVPDLSTTSIGTNQASSAQVVDLSQYVTVCTDAQLQGKCQSFGAGTVSDLSTLGLSSNISSIHVSPAVTLYLNDQVNLSGQPGIFNGDVTDLTASNWNDRAKSLKIENRNDVSCNNDQNQNGILLYRNTNFDTGGGCILLTGDNNDLGVTHNFTTGTSLQFVGSYSNHYQVQIYTDANYGTLCGTYTVNQSDLLACAGKTASIRIQPYTPPTPANNIAYLAARDHGGSDAVVDNDLSTTWLGGHPSPLGFVYAQPVTIQDVTVFDRAQNSPDNNQINKVSLAFSDGTVINNVDMVSGGPRCADISFPAKTITWVNVLPTDSSGNNGYREIQIWDTAGVVSSPNNCVNKVSATPVAGSGTAPLVQNIAPQMSSQNYTIQQGQTNTFFVQATDPGNVVSLSASSLPGSVTFTDYGQGTGAFIVGTGAVPGTYQIPVQASNGTLTTTATVTLTVTPPPAPLALSCIPNWTCLDISNDGSQSPVTSYASDGTLTTGGTGSDIWGTTDHFHYNSLPLSGDGYISARLVSQTNTSGWAKTGLMIRNSTAGNAAFYFPQMTPSNGISVQYRTADGANAASVDGYTPPYPLPLYLKASRTGNQYSSYISQDGSNWTLIPNSTVTINGIGASALEGLAVTSHDSTQISTAIYTNIVLGVPPPTSAPCNTGWTCENINNDGVTNLTTSYSSSTGAWTTQGSGSDIWTTADHFHFNDTPLNGDGGISARLASQSNTSDWAKSGVMIRDSNATGAAYYSILVTNGHGFTVQYRTASGASAQDALDSPGAAPLYLKVYRKGTTYTAYTSSDGITWSIVVGSTRTISSIRATGALEGLAVTSHNTGAANTAVFDHVQPLTTATSATFDNFKNGISSWSQGSGPVSLGTAGGVSFLRFSPASNSSSESNRGVNAADLANYNSISVTINLNGATILGNDASALYLSQGGSWKYISLSNYVQQGLNGWQTVTIPLTAFSGFNKTQSFSSLGFRFWVNNASTIDVTNIVFNP
ncbi:MAG TPA: hypothetical protein VLH84_04245 [Patescibacteria group bacterium]|nr:hypothetical protein [Patescibacteria group bacterium]